MMLDCFGVPEYFATDVGDVEDAGGGNIRIVRCIKRGGVLVPVYSLVTPALQMVIDAPRVREVAIEILKRENINFTPPHH